MLFIEWIVVLQLQHLDSSLPERPCIIVAASTHRVPSTTSEGAGEHLHHPTILRTSVVSAYKTARRCVHTDGHAHIRHPGVLANESLGSGKGIGKFFSIIEQCNDIVAGYWSGSQGMHDLKQRGSTAAVVCRARAGGGRIIVGQDHDRASRVAAMQPGNHVLQSNGPLDLDLEAKSGQFCNKIIAQALLGGGSLRVWFAGNDCQVCHGALR